MLIKVDLGQLPFDTFADDQPTDPFASTRYNDTFLIQNNLKSCFMPLEPQILSLCIISKSLGKFRVIESIHGIVRDVDDQPFH